MKWMMAALLLVSHATFAAKKVKTPAKTVAPPEDIIMEVPRSGITIPQPEPSHAKATTYFEFNSSTWAPSGVVTNSRLENTTAFQKQHSTRTSFNIAIGEWDSRFGFVSPKIGLSYLALRRSGFLSFANGGYSVDQDLSLYQGRLGLEWVPHEDLVSHLRPYVGASALPVWLQSASSQFDEGISEFRWMGEVDAGVSYNFKPVANALGFSLIAATLGVETTELLSARELAGSGVNLGLRISWN
jgi:hypothetical protein